VQVVRLRYPASIEIEIDWRRPVARVNRSMVVDRHGVVLNLMWNSAKVSDVPCISGVNCAHTSVGRQVPEKDIHDAIALLNVVREGIESFRLKVADVRRESSGMWQIVTDRGPLVRWGAFTDDPPMDEPRTREKVDLLRRLMVESKDPTSLEEVTVYHTNGSFRPRIASGR
jgi:hypothetical protein